MEPANSSIQQTEDSGQRLSEDFGIFEVNAPDFHDVSSNEPDDDNNAKLQYLCSRAFFDVAEVRPLYPEYTQTTQEEQEEHQQDFWNKRNEAILEHEIVTVAEISAGSQKYGENLTGFMEREDTLMAGIMIEERPERPESRNSMSDIDI